MKSTVRERARAADWQEGAKTVARRTQNEMADSRGQTVAGTSQAASAARASQGASAARASQGASAGDLRRTSSAKAVQASARKSMSVDARRRQQPTKRAASQSARRSYSQGIKTGSRYVGSEDRARARAKARKKKWRRQRRMLLSVLFLLVLVVAGAVLFNMVRSRQREREKQELLAAGIEQLKSGSYEEAIVSLDNALQWSGENIGDFEKEALLHRAEAECHLQDYDAALHTYELLRTSDEENSEYKTGAAICMLAKGDTASALALGVIDGHVYNHMAVEKIRSEEYDAALELIDKGMAAGNEEANQYLLYNQAIAWESKGDFVKALELFESYTAQYGPDEQAEREITFLKSRQGNSAAASQESTSAQESVASQESTSAQESAAGQESVSAQESTSAQESSSAQEGAAG